MRQLRVKLRIEATLDFHVNSAHPDARVHCMGAMGEKAAGPRSGNVLLENSTRPGSEYYPNRGGILPPLDPPSLQREMREDG